MRGFDAAFDTTQYLTKFRHEVDFIARYYSFNPMKDLTKPEAEAVTKAGLSIVSIFQAVNSSYGGFTPLIGNRDATKALNAATAIGQPTGSAIYFAVDFDAQDPGSNKVYEIRDYVIPYFRAVNMVLKGQYLVGVYGSGLVCRILKNLRLATYCWLAASTGWSESDGFKDYNIIQSPPGDPYGFGVSIDPDLTQSDLFGQWSFPKPVIIGPDAVIPSCVELQTALKSLGLYTGKIDGIIGPLTYLALRTYYRGGHV